MILPSATLGGAEVRARRLLRALDGFAPVLLTQDAIADHYRDLNIPVHSFDAAGCRDPHDFSLSNMLAYARVVARRLRRERPQAAFAFMHTGTLHLALGRLLAGYRGRAVGSILGNLSEYFRQRGSPPSLYEKFFLRLCLRVLDGVVTPSEGVRQDLVAHFGLRPQRTRVILNGIDVEEVRRLSRAGAPPLAKDCPWILTSCRLESQKDFVTLLEAFARIRAQRKARLVILGEGPLRVEILALAEGLGVAADVSLVGFQENPFPWVAQGDVFVLSSFFEGLPNVLVEAMALEVPVVSTRCPDGPDEVITHGEDGYLVEVGDAGRLADHCLSLLADTEKARIMGRKGLQRARQLTLARMAAAYRDYLLKTPC